MPKKILAYALLFLTMISAFFAWQSVDGAIFKEGSSDFLVPLLLFSFLATAICLSIVLVREKIYFWIVIFLSLLLSLIFVQNFFHIFAIILAWLFLFTAQKSINEDIDSSVKIRLMKSLHRGIFLMVIAFVLMISSQYYFSISRLSAEEITPNISRGGATVGMINLILPKISPEFQKVKSDELDVDEFLGEIYEIMLQREGEQLKNSLAPGAEILQKEQAVIMLEKQLGRRLSEEEKMQMSAIGGGEALNLSTISPQVKKGVLEEWKKELSKSAGFQIMGNEKVAEIFIAIMNSKISDLVEPQIGKEKSRFLPLLFTLILFFSLISIGSLVSRLWTVVAAGIFWILRRTGAVKIEMEMKEVEVIR